MGLRDTVPPVGTPAENDRVEREIWIDGDFIPWEKANIHVLSHSAQRGSLVFDYLSVHATSRGPAIFRLAEHLARFEHSCEMIGLRLEVDSTQLCRALIETIARNPGARAAKVSAYLPSIEVDVVPLDDRVSVAIAAYDPQADVIARKARKADPRPTTLRLWIEKERRNRRDDIIPPQAKVAANYLSTMTAKARAREAGYDEILLVDEYGYVAEAPTANLFIVDADGMLATPPVSRVLLGVTRMTILDLAHADGIPVCETTIRPEELFEASEVFLTGTTAGVWPVSSIDGKKIGITGGEIGPVARALQEHFERVTSGNDPDFLHWLTLVE